MAKFSDWLAEQGVPWPSHLWAGTSITDQKTTSRIKHLSCVGDSETIRFLSVEPQVEPVNLAPFLPEVDWVIHGGESGRGARAFSKEWAVELIDACKALSIPYFLKQLGAVVEDRGNRLTFKDAHAGDWNEWPSGLAVREFPEC
jgi:protein gp37